MEIFDVHRRDVYNFDDYMDLKKPGFGGPSSAEPMYTESRGKVKRVNKDPKLKEFQRTVHRPIQNNQFTHEVYNPTYKAIGGDLVHKQEVGKNPYDYPDPYGQVGIGMVNMGKTNEGMCHSNFTRFLMESAKGECECGDDCSCKDCKTHKRGKYAVKESGGSYWDDWGREESYGSDEEHYMSIIQSDEFDDYETAQAWLEDQGLDSMKIDSILDKVFPKKSTGEESDCDIDDYEL